MRWQRLNDLEGPFCAAWNHRGDRKWLRRGFRAVSRLGDGVIWYLTMALLPLSFGASGLQASLHMATVGVLSLLVYKMLKQGTNRPRPCDYHRNIRELMPALDEFSFPSGHTLHAVAFTLVVAGYFPALGLFYGSFTALVAASRLVLGLHYPSDVIAGAVIGGTIASLTLLLV